MKNSIIPRNDVDQSISTVQELLKIEIEKLDKEIASLELQKNGILSTYSIITTLKSNDKSNINIITKSEKNGPIVKAKSPRMRKDPYICFCGHKTHQLKEWNEHKKSCPGRPEEIKQIKISDYEPPEYKGDKQYYFNNGKFRCHHCSFFTSGPNDIKKHVRLDCPEAKEAREAN